ncbi:DUF554 domain-containing protein [Pseudobacillus badius]|uniref:DUF554 domain-containing protein n=1 Tax=Bacillus badius TaxID=1455 RepID=UPI0007B090D2|nr:DUF554 domain-containing protein [Bacillus badius]KZN98284.1 hypothetical protein A4244_09745 [Bacillus badius]MED0666767.1 DUF554 domain-containing protein [Bacillus badius]OCS82652.1 hypothetical protein A6M11_09755 [Bacillus badius]OVE51357.1 hypothetical protein B1A98_11675 [Bacillus badius]TDW02460.1 hypothetical protein B0G66_10618 [Bacillus badius]
MVLYGSIINGLTIIFGALLGKWLNRIPEGIKGTVMQAIGLAVVVLGLQMGLKSADFLTVIISLVIGAALGELLMLDERLNQVGLWLERKIGKETDETSISQGFVTATLIFVIGAMGIIGALDSGIRGNHEVLLTKAIIDGVTALILTTTLGIGVMFSAVPVILYEGIIALFATQIDRFVPKEWMDAFIVEMTAAGGIMILAIGLNLLGLTKIRVANLLPSLVCVGVIITIQYLF